MYATCPYSDDINIHHSLDVLSEAQLLRDGLYHQLSACGRRWAEGKEPKDSGSFFESKAAKDLFRSYARKIVDDFKYVWGLWQFCYGTSWNALIIPLSGGLPDS
jgi:hypothetical protein